jgi:riboflavin kinase/FMN adenylyltransferase
MQGETRRTILIRHTIPDRAKSKKVIAALGNFDGIHCGHQKILRRLTELAAAHVDSVSLLISFYPRPATVVRSAAPAPRLTTLRQTLQLCSDLNITILHKMHFTKALSNLSAAEFIDQILIDGLNVDTLLLGPDAAFGKGRGGTLTEIERLLKLRKRNLEIIPAALHVDGTRISSSTIRALLAEGQVQAAQDLLGRPYAMEGRVIRGAGRGKTIGIPTANLGAIHQLTPKPGVYACYADVNGSTYPAVTNIGNRPTFAGKDTTIEAHLLDYKGESFYDKRITLHFVDRLRDEHRFESVPDLVAAIQADIAKARSLF